MAIKDRGTVIFNLTYFRPSSGMNPDHQALYAQQPILADSAVEVFTARRKIGRYGVVPQRSAVGDDGIEEQSHRSDGDRCGEAVQDRSGSERAVVPIQAVSGSLCGGQRKGLNDNPITGRRDTRFFPFNKDIENPVNPDGHKTAYLWEDILQAR